MSGSLRGWLIGCGIGSLINLFIFGLPLTTTLGIFVGCSLLGFAIEHWVSNSK